MSLPEKRSPFITGVLHTEAPGLWDKVRGGLGAVVTTVAKLAHEILPQAGEAAALYSAKPNVPNLSLMPDFSTYHGQSTPVVLPNLTLRRPIPSYKPSRTGEKAVAQIQHPESSLQKVDQWQAIQNQAFQTLNQLARAKGLPSYEQFHRENGVIDMFRPDQRDRGAKRFLAGEISPPTRRFLSEPSESIQGAQQPVSYAQLLQARIQQSSEPRQDFTAKKRPNTRQSSTDKPFQRKHGASQVQQVVQQAFVDPRPGEPDILKQARQGRVAGHRMAQVELNLARMHAQGHITPEQQAHLEIGAKALFAANWLRHDGQDVGNGHITYRGITVERSLAPMLAYADAEQYWRQNTHLSPKQDWMDQLQKTATGLLKGLANGIVAGAGPKASRGEEGAYAVGDVLGAIGVNVAALFAGPLAPAVWVGYGLAREANREVDAGKPLNPVAIAASGAISAIPGTTAMKVPFGVAGRIGAGMAAGYASDLANRGVQQLGDTGRNDVRQLDYTPGWGTLTGGTVGLLSYPGVSQAFQKYLLGRQAQLRNGEKVPVSLDDFEQVAHIRVSERKVWFDDKQVAKKYMRHAPQLGIMENYSPRQAEYFKVFIMQHVMNPKTKMISGTYRKTIPVVHYYNSKTNINVMTLVLDNGKFHTVWPLTKEQIYYLYKTGNIQ